MMLRRLKFLERYYTSGRRQLNVKVCSSESAFLLRPLVEHVENGSSTHRHFITKLMLITLNCHSKVQHCLHAPYLGGVHVGQYRELPAIFKASLVESRTPCRVAHASYS